MNDLRNKTEEFLNSLFDYLQQTNNARDEKVNNLNEKINLLQTNVEKLLMINRQLLEQNNRLLEKGIDMVSVKDSTLELQTQKVSSPIVSPIEETNVKENEEGCIEAPKKEEVVESAKVEPQPPIEEKQEPQPPKEDTAEEREQEPEQTETKEEKPTSSVLDFLHQRVMKDKTLDRTAMQQASMPSSQTSSIRTITEQVKSEVKTDKQHRSIADTFEQANNIDLMSAIGVCEKFMFINDLFSGNIKDYNKFVCDLNACSTFEASMDIVETFQKQKRWAKTSLAYTTLEGIIDRRFN